MGNQSIDALAKKLQSTNNRFERVEKEVRGLKDLLNVHDNWHSTIREWIGHSVIVCDRNGDLFRGVLKWYDRYTICISEIPQTKVRIYTKGGINWIEPA